MCLYKDNNYKTNKNFLSLSLYVMKLLLLLEFQANLDRDNQDKNKTRKSFEISKNINSI
jgi:hypothetical protein